VITSNTNIGINRYLGVIVHSLRHLELIRTLAQHRHFGRAAAALGVSQPALTRSLKHLEVSLGVSLFDREGVAPTVFGQIVLDRCDVVLGEFAELMRAISLAKGLDVGEIRVAAGPYAADISGQRAIGLLSAAYPRIAVELSIVNWTRAKEEVLEGRADLGVGDISELDGHTDLEVEPLRTARFHFFCAKQHPLAQRPTVSLEDLLDFPWIGPTVPMRMRDFLPRVDKPFGVFSDSGDRFFPRIVVGTFPAAKEIALAGLGLAAAIPSQIRRELDDGSAVLLPIHLPWFHLAYGFITKRGRSHSPATLAFMRIVRRLELEIGDDGPA